MSLLRRAQELEDISDEQLAQLVQQGSEAGDTWLAATETQRRKDTRDRYQAELAKQQAANPPDIMTQRMAELGGGIASADPNMGAPPDPSLQTGIAGPPQGGPPPMMADGGLIRGYQEGNGIGIGPVKSYKRAMTDTENDELLKERAAELIQKGYRPGEERYDTQMRDYHMELEGFGPSGGGGFSPARLARDPGYYKKEEGTEGLGSVWADPRREAIFPNLTSSMTPSGAAPYLANALMRRLTGKERPLTEFGAREFEEYQRVRDQSATNPEAAEYYRRMGVDPSSRESYQKTASRKPHRESLVGRALNIFQPATTSKAPDFDSEEGQKIREAIGVMPDGEVIPQGEEEELSTYEELLALGGSAGGSALSRSRGIVDQLTSELRDFTPADVEAARRKRANEDERLKKAQGIHTLRGTREKEQERILAHRLGLSEAAVRELMREMDTPEEVESRRKSAGYGGLSRMFLNPNLAEGIAGVGKGIRDTDDILRAERESALEKIRAERKDAGLLEQQGRTGIFDTKLGAQQGLDKAELARLDLDYDQVQAIADRGRAGAAELARLGLGIEEMAFSEEQAVSAAERASSAAFQEALNNRELFLNDPKNWEAVMDRHKDAVHEIEGNPTLSDADRKAKLELLHKLAISRIQAVGVTEVSEINRILAMGGRRT